MNNPLEDQAAYEKLIRSLMVVHQLSYAEIEQRLNAAIRGNPLGWREVIAEFQMGVMGLKHDVLSIKE